MSMSDEKAVVVYTGGLWVLLALLLFGAGCATKKATVVEDTQLVQGPTVEEVRISAQQTITDLARQLMACKEANEQLRKRLDDCLNAGEK